MGHEIDRLEGLSEQLLATSQLAQGLNQIKPVRHDLSEAARHCLERQQSVLQARGARLFFCLLYTSDAADELDGVSVGGRRISKRKKDTS